MKTSAVISVATSGLSEMPSAPITSSTALRPATAAAIAKAFAGSRQFVSEIEKPGVRTVLRGVLDGEVAAEPAVEAAEKAGKTGGRHQ